MDILKNGSVQDAVVISEETVLDDEEIEEVETEEVETEEVETEEVSSFAEIMPVATPEIGRASCRERV